MTDQQNQVQQQSLDTAQITQMLGEIHKQNIQLSHKIDDLQTNLTRKATIAGAMAGAFTGGVTGGVVGVGVELIKAKFGM